MKNGNEEGPSQRLQATGWVRASAQLVALVAQHPAEAHLHSVPRGCLSYSTLSVFQEGPVPIWVFIKKGEI